METLGARLKKLRLEKGISLEEVRKKTKIHLDILKSIEDDSLVNLNPVYIKGFVKIYCGFLGVDFQEYLSEFKANGSVIRAVPPVLAVSRRGSEPRKKDKDFFSSPERIKFFFKAGAVIGIILIVVFSFLSLGLGKIIFTKVAAFKKFCAQLVLPKSKLLNQRGMPAYRQGRVSRPMAKTVKSSQFKTAIVPKAAKKDVQAVPSLASAGNQELGVRIGIHALDDCWIQARIDGKIIFQNVLKKGRFESWSAKDKVELVLGSAGSVRLEVNGKLIPSLGRKGQILKNILITKDGLKVGK